MKLCPQLVAEVEHNMTVWWKRKDWTNEGYEIRKHMDIYIKNVNKLHKSDQK